MHLVYKRKLVCSVRPCPVLLSRLTYRPKSVCNCCVIEVFIAVCVSLLCFDGCSVSILALSYDWVRSLPFSLTPHEHQASSLVSQEYAIECPMYHCHWYHNVRLSHLTFVITIVISIFSITMGGCTCKCESLVL